MINTNKIAPAEYALLWSYVQSLRVRARRTATQPQGKATLGRFIQLWGKTFPNELDLRPIVLTAILGYGERRHKKSGSFGWTQTCFAEGPILIIEHEILNNKEEFANVIYYVRQQVTLEGEASCDPRVYFSEQPSQ